MAPHAPAVLVVVFDGLRPDLATPERMPALSAFLGAARVFPNASGVFPSSTRVCAASIGTGAPPGVHGVVQNAWPEPALFPDRFLDTARVDHLRRARAHHGRDFVSAPRFADAIAAAGRRLAVVHSGAAGGAWLLDPRARANGSWVFSVHGREATETPEAWDRTTARLGSPPQAPAPKTALMAYTADALVEVALPEAVPDVALVWMNEPDFSSHHLGLDSPGTRAAMAASDAAFARMLAAVRRAPGGERTTVIAASDHGHVTVVERVPLAEHLAAAGFEAAFDRPGADLSVFPGTACCVWPRDGVDPARLARLAAALREQPWCGPLFTAGGNGVEGAAPGSFDLALLGGGALHPRTPALVAVLASGEGPDIHGLPGTSSIAGKDVPVGGGMHGGLHRAEMANLIAVGGPATEAEHDLRAAGLIDLAPTILGRLHLAPTPGMAGQDLLGPPASGRPPRLFETGVGAYRQALSLHGDGRGAILSRAWRMS